MTSPNWRAYTAAIRRDADLVAEGRSRDARPEDLTREAGPDEHRAPSVRALYEETLCRPLRAAIRMKRRKADEQ